MKVIFAVFVKFLLTEKSNKLIIVECAKKVLARGVNMKICSTAMSANLIIVRVAVILRKYLFVICIGIYDIFY